LLHLVGCFIRVIEDVRNHKATRPKRSKIKVVAPKEEEEEEEEEEKEVNTWNPSEVMLWVDVICLHRKQMHSRPVGVPLTEVDSVQEHRED
jgi:hypothetical protein